MGRDSPSRGIHRKGEEKEVQNTDFLGALGTVLKNPNLRSFRLPVFLFASEEADSWAHLHVIPIDMGHEMAL
jgi:hypothetical protein